jgi:23S rRNA (cytosine1962-C5)-methyltransferase
VAIEAQLQAALARRAALGLPSRETDAYRLIHGASDGFEGLTVDVYDRYLVASLYTEQRGPREEAWLTALAELGYAGIYLKQRPKQANKLAEAERKARAPEHAVLGTDAPERLIIREHDVPFAVRLGDGLSTGLFLDQRDNRARFAALAAHKRVLNLFSYTCAFGVVAARAGAIATTNVDVSKAALERGKENYALIPSPSGSGLPIPSPSGSGPLIPSPSGRGLGRGQLRPDSEHHFLARDVLESLPRMQKRGETFDLIALDPPSYASTKHGRFSVERDYAQLAASALALLAPGGTLLACLNHARMSERDFQNALEGALRSVGPRTLRLSLVPPPPDHPPLPGSPPHLKSAWIST